MKTVAVIGGANVDVKLSLQAPAVPGTSNPGARSQSLGGVARNVAENLARLGVKAQLISAVGQDGHGEALLRDTRAAGVNVDGVLCADEATGTYTAVLDPTGELVIAVAAMAVTDHLTPESLGKRREVIAQAALVIADANLTEDALGFVAGTAHEAGLPLIVEPVSVPKAAKVRSLLQRGAKLHTLTPNRAELAVLLGRELPDDADLIEAAREVQALGAARVWVRLGARGSLLLTGEGVWELPALPALVRDVTGAGDAMLAGYAFGLLTGQDDFSSALLGHAAAALTLESAHTVFPDLSPAALLKRAQGAAP